MDPNLPHLADAKRLWDAVRAAPHLSSAEQVEILRTWLARSHTLGQLNALAAANQAPPRTRAVLDLIHHLRVACAADDTKLADARVLMAIAAATLSTGPSGEAQSPTHEPRRPLDSRPVRLELSGTELTALVEFDTGPDYEKDGATPRQGAKPLVKAQAQGFYFPDPEATCRDLARQLSLDCPEVEQVIDSVTESLNSGDLD